MKTALMTLALIGAAESRMGFGSCPEVATQPNFDMARHQGAWYEHQRDKLFAFEMGQECGTQNYQANADGGWDLYFRAQFWMMFGTYAGIGGKMTECGTSTEGTCMATMGETSDKKYPIDILSTDYDNWSVMYACSDMLGGDLMYGQWLSISTRDNSPISETNLAAAHAAIRAQLPTFDLSSFAMWNTSQKNCDYDWNKWS